MLHIVWSDDRDGNEEIYYKRSTNGGLFWGGDTRLTNSTNHLSEYPQFSVSGSFLHLVWQKLINSNWIIFYKRSTDEGTSWGADVSLSSDSITSMIPSISSSGQFVHIAWEDHQSQRLIYKRSTNGGQSWEANKFISNNLGAGSPSISVNGSIVHVVWYNGMGNIDYNRSTDGGISWGAETQLTIDSHASFMPSVSASGAFVHVTWEDLRNGGSNSEIYYKRSSNGGLNWGADTRLTNADYYSENSFVTVSGSVVHVVWIDGRTDENNAEIYYKRNPTGNTIGIKNINSDIPDKFSLSQNYPNPFNPSTIIRYKIKDSRFVTLKVYDILGKVVATLVNEKQSPGEYELPFSINQFSGYQIPSGIYFYTLRAGDYVETKKMLMIK
jgi:hypothetical protein